MIKDVNPRPRYKDGTPAHTLSVNHVVHKYDISKFEFPITTLRPISFRKAIGEILWIYQDESNNLDVLKNKYGISWWDSWDIGDRTIGSCYGETVRRHNLMHKLLDDIKNDPCGDSIEEAYRRSLSDVGQFDGIEDEVDFVINNHKYEKMVEYIMKEINDCMLMKRVKNAEL